MGDGHRVRVRITGPLAPFVDRLWRSLRGSGYTWFSSRNILRVTAQLSRWSVQHGICFQRFDRGELARFFAFRRRAGCTAFVCSQSLESALGPLEAMGAIRWVKPKAIRANAFDRLFTDYAAYLLSERGINEGAANTYIKVGRRFLTRLDLRRLDADDVTSFILNESRQYSIGTTKLAITALRSLLGFLFRRGATQQDLSTAVPAIAGWRMSGLPKAFERGQVRKLLRACDRRSRQGRRDLAVLLLMTRLGLRAGEVSRLSLDDIDWRRGEIVLRGKGRRQDRLPLPADVGGALARFLSDRTPGTKERAVFLRQMAPHRGLKVGGIQSIVNGCLRRAGLPPGNSHRLRHTAATQILRCGGTLDDIAQVLRHKSHDTTAIYAKVDLRALRRVMRRWPGGER